MIVYDSCMVYSYLLCIYCHLFAHKRDFFAFSLWPDETEKTLGVPADWTHGSCEIDSIVASQFDWDVFEKHYVAARRPLLIRGGPSKVMECHGHTENKWNPEKSWHWHDMFGMFVLQPQPCFISCRSADERQWQGEIYQRRSAWCCRFSKSPGILHSLRGRLPWCCSCGDELGRLHRLFGSTRSFGWDSSEFQLRLWTSAGRWRAFELRAESSKALQGSDLAPLGAVYSWWPAHGQHLAAHV